MQKFAVNTIRRIAYLSAFNTQFACRPHPCLVRLPLTNASPMSSLSRCRFSAECENAINKQINKELYASYVYLSMAYHFDRDDVALPGMHWYFKTASDEERDHALKFMTYLNKRGGRIVLEDIKRPETREWASAEDAMCLALELEKDVNENLLNMHAMASEHNDANFCDFLETEFLQEQVDAIKQIADHVTNLKRVGEGLGVYLFDKHIKDAQPH